MQGIELSVHLCHIEKKKKIEIHQSFKLFEFCVAILFHLVSFMASPECGLSMKERNAYTCEESKLVIEIAYSLFCRDRTNILRRPKQQGITKSGHTEEEYASHNNMLLRNIKQA